MIIIKLLLWLNYGEFMKVGEGRNLEYHSSLGCIFEFSVGFPTVAFTMDDLIMMLSLKCYRSHWKVKKCS